MNATPNNHEALIASARRQVNALSSVGSSERFEITSVEIPGYRIDRPLHRGGQGVVYRAVQESTGRAVAIKLMGGHAQSSASSHEHARFEREIHILSQLDHPNIVGIIDSGEVDGQHYFVMEYVDGVTLDEHCKASRHQGIKASSEGSSSLDASMPRWLDPSSLEDKLLLFAGVCDAVHAAHLHGVIHRDLKPGNVLVDSMGRPHVLDFGLAKLFTPETGVRDQGLGIGPLIPNPSPLTPAVMTETGQFLGSLPWASPEQVSGNGNAIDIRSDVYSLGVMLYQLLTGEFPYRVSGPIREITDNILSVDPARPSTVSPSSRAINDEVETIVLKTLSKEPERRYQSAGDLARDIRHYLDGELIEAKRDSLTYVLRKQLRRYWIAATVAAAFLIVITAGLLVSLTGWQTAAAEEKQSEAEFNKAQAINKVLNDTLAAANLDVAGGEELSVREVLDAAALEIDAGSLKNQREVEAAVRHTLGEAYLSLGRLDQAREQLQSARTIREEALGPRHEQVAEIISDLADLARIERDLPRSEQLHNEALAILRATHAGDHDSVADELVAIGWVTWEKGSADAGVALAREGLEMQRRMHGDQDPRVARTKTDLASMMHDAGASEALLREALDTYRAALGPKHPEVARVLIALAGNMHVKRDYAAAERLYLEGLALNREIFGENHPAVIQAVYNLGWLYQNTEQTDERAALLTQYRAAAERTFGHDSAQYAEYLNMLASAVGLNGRHDQAIAGFEEGLVILKRIGQDQGDTAAECRNSLAVYHIRAGELDKAEERVRQTLAMNEQALPAYHRMRAQAHSLLGEVLTARGEFAEAERELLAGYEGLVAARVPGPYRPKAIERLIRLYEALHAAEPGGGHDQQAERWRGTLREMQVGS